MSAHLDRTIPLCRVALAVAAHRGDWLASALRACRESSALAPGDVEEAILQGVPYSGFPGAGEALARWRESGESQIVAGSDDPARGPEIFQEVYGAVAERVRGELRRRHPALETWILDFAYGRVMGRGILDLDVLEALGVASLLAQKRHPPLHSHLRGAVRAGWSPDALLALLNALTDWCDDETVSYARKTIEGLREDEE